MDRIKKINELIKQEVNSIIITELELPLGTLVTITSVNTSKDLAYSKIFISVLPLENTQQTLAILKKSDIQNLLFKKLSIRRIPKIAFKIDATEAKAEKIEELLDKIKKNPYAS